MRILAKVGSYLVSTLGTPKAIDRRLLPRNPPGSHTQVRADESDPAWGWTLDDVVAYLKMFADGDIAAGEQLRLAMMRDSVIAECVETRVEIALQKDRWWEKPEECPQWFFDLWVKNWQEALSYGDQQQIGEYRLMLGLGLTNQTWRPEKSGRLWMPTLYRKDPGNLEYVETNGVYNYEFHGRLHTYCVDNDGVRFLLWERKGSRSHLAGLIIPLAIVWITKQEALRQWPSRNKSHGKSWRLAEFPADQRESDDVKAWLENVKALLAGGVVPLPKYEKDLPSFDLRLLSENTDVSATFENLIRLCDEYIRQTILGVSENTSGGSASDAKARTQDTVFLRKIKSDCKLDTETLRILARCFCRLNEAPVEWAPIYCVDARVPADEAELAAINKDKASAAKDMATVIQILRGGGQPAQPTQGGQDPKPQPGEEIDAAYMLEQVGVYTKRAAGVKEVRDTY